MRIEVLSPLQWSEYAEAAHAIAFNEIRPVYVNRLDFAFLVVDEDKPLAFTTFREHDSETIYFQFGGAFPTAIGSTTSFKCYSLVVDKIKSLGYKSATTLVKNTNIVMLKFAFKVGFKIIGVKCVNNEIFCELLLGGL